MEERVTGDDVIAAQNAISREFRHFYEADYLSQLHDDCLFDIFTRLDHDDLDEIATLSGKLRMLSDSSRSRAMKVDAFSLKLTQVTNVQFFIVIKTGGEDFYVDNSNQYVFSERMKRLKVEVKPNPEEHPQNQKSYVVSIVANRIIALLDRFDFSHIFLKGVSIDNHIVRCIIQLASSRSFKYLNMEYCAADENLSSESRARLLSKQLSAKPRLWLWCFSINIDELFLTEYANRVPFPELTVIDKSDIIEPDENFGEVLVKYKTLYFLSMCFEVDWLMHHILIRLRLRTAGQWFFGLMEISVLDQIVNAVPADCKYSYSFSDRGDIIHTIGIDGTNHRANICPNYFGDGEWWDVHFEDN